MKIITKKELSENNKHIRIEKITEYKVKNGQLTLSGAYSPVKGAKGLTKIKFPNLKLTQLYRILFNDQRCTTWEGADCHPVCPGIFAMELHYRYIAIYADFGDVLRPILLDFRDKPIKLTETYQRINWIEKATESDFQEICDWIADRFQDSINEVKTSYKLIS